MEVTRMLPPDAFCTDKIKLMDDAECLRLCDSLRSELVTQVSQTGGHLASNLGVVELTVAIHRVFDLSKDRLVFDVGHQCYSHKMLTGRMEQMGTLRQEGGISGFPKPQESIYDAFVAGHASNAVSVALGMARARTIQKEEYQVLALLGDGALTGGLAYEGMSNAGHSKEHMIVILNDNGMSIMKNVGGIADHLSRQRLKPQYLRIKNWYRRVTGRTRVGRKVYRFTHKLKKVVKESLLPCSFFEDMGFGYLGPVDGHDVNLLTKTLEYAKGMEGPVVVHVRTVKGKGYSPAEQNPDAFHGVSPFDLVGGQPKKESGLDFSAVFGETLCQLAEKNPKVCAITAAMQSGTGLNGFAQQFPERFFDVGIAEGHAVSMAGGMAAQGLVPVFAVYSTFLQRSFDMLIHDIALEGLHAVFCVDRAGLVGSDGETHQGVFDVDFLSAVPGMTILAPASFEELRQMLRQAVEEIPGPVAVRYPRGGENDYSEDHSQGAEALLRAGADLTIVTYGTLVGEALKAADMLEEEDVQVELIKLNRIDPVPWEQVAESIQKTRRLLVVEEVASQGCVGETLLAMAEAQGVSLTGGALLNLGQGIVQQGTVTQQRARFGIDSQGIFQRAKEVLNIG
jgi:1-deoxy-D-xylulose-5-phosphate synthase